MRYLQYKINGTNNVEISINLLKWPIQKCSLFLKTTIFLNKLLLNGKYRLPICQAISNMSIEQKVQNNNKFSQQQ